VLAQPAAERDVEGGDIDPADVAPHPFVEDADEKVAILPATHRALRHAAGRRRCPLLLHDGNELDEASAGDVPQEAIDLQRVAGVGSVHRAQDIELHVMSLEDVQAAHDALERRLAGPIATIGVV